MIDYLTYCQIHDCHNRKGLKVSQIAEELGLDERTVSNWLNEKTYRPRAGTGIQGPSKLDPFKEEIVRLLERHPYTAVQILQQIRQAGYQGGYTILKDYVKKVRPPKRPAYLTLEFAPGECAQIDWGNYGSVPVGSTRRRLSFFVMVLCYSRLMYVEFSLAEKMEHFLSAHQNALQFIGGVPSKIMFDNAKVAVLSHPPGAAPVFNPRYLDFAAHYGFEPVACNVRKPHEKGRVENGVGYVKKNLLAGLEITHFETLHLTGRGWMDNVANCRIHGETKERPIDRFAAEKASLSPLPEMRYDVSVTDTVLASNQCWVRVDENRYSVPPRLASRKVLLKRYPDRICLYHERQLVVTHTRSYDRRQKIRDPDHQKELLTRRPKAREQQLLSDFLALCGGAQTYYQQLTQKHLHPMAHIRKIMALTDVHGRQAVARAIEDALEFNAFGSDYISNLLDQRHRLQTAPGPLHLTRREDLLELEVPPADLNLYNLKDSGTSLS